VNRGRDEKVVGFHNIGDRMKFWGKLGYPDNGERERARKNGDSLAPVGQRPLCADFR
jgi:hypothetical protein